MSGYTSEEARAIDRLMRSTEALRTRKQANYIVQERMLLDALTEQWPEPHLRLRLRLVAMAGIGALRLAADAWSAEGGQRSLQAHLAEVCAALRDDITRRGQ